MKCFKQSSKRWLAMALSLVMCLGLLQMPAMAAEGEGSKIVQSAFQYAQNLDQGDTCNVIIRRAPVATGYGIIDSSIVVSDNGDDWEYAGTTSCVIIVPKAID